VQQILLVDGKEFNSDVKEVIEFENELEQLKKNIWIKSAF